jgi:hypothetical protein
MCNVDWFHFVFVLQKREKREKKEREKREVKKGKRIEKYYDLNR